MSTKTEPKAPLRISISDAMTMLGYKSDDSIFRLLARNVLSDLRSEEDRKKRGSPIWLDPKEVEMLAAGEHQKLRAYRIKKGRKNNY